MPTSLVEGASLLALDVGAATTRAVLFDVVEGEYRFLATGAAPSTAEAPFKDVSDGAREAIGNLQAVTGRTLLDGDRKLITPGQPDGSGVDAFAATISAGPALKTVIAGLLSDVSLDSARRLAETSYTRLLDSIGLNDHRRSEQQLDSLLRLRPDIVVITGGADGGASRSIQKMLDPIGLASYLLPQDKRPAVLYAGNQKMNKEVKEVLGGVTSGLHFSSNVRPSLETEDLQPAARELAALTIEVRKRQLRGVDVLQTWAGGHILPTAYAEGRMMRFLSRLYGGSKGLLNVDIGASAAVISAGFGEKFMLGVYPQFGLGENLPALLQYCELEDILRWSSLDVSTGVLRDYLYQKSLYPSSIPATLEEQAISQAITRQALYLAMQTALRDFPPSARAPRPGLPPPFEPILAGGGALTDAPTPGKSMLLILDAIQPVGVTTVIIDRNNLLPLLGAAAGHNSLLPVQVIGSGAFQSQGTVVSVLASAGQGAQILRAKLSYEDGSEARVDLKYGNIEVLPLAAGASARLALQPQHNADAGFGPGRGGTVTVSGGALGVVFDGRGRPLSLPADGARRREMIKKWSWTLGG